MCAPHKTHKGCRSPRERGLKHIRKSKLLTSMRVAPRAGAWIETLTRLGKIAWLAGRSPRERGLKLYIMILHWLFLQESLPARERGLKLVR